MISLKSSDGETLEIEKDAAVESQLLKNMIERDDFAYDTIPVPNVTSKILAKVIEYCRKHAKASGEGAVVDIDGDLEKFDADFVNVDWKTLYHLVMAAHFLIIESLYNLTCKTMAGIIKGKPIEDMRKLFNMENDFSPEEEVKILKEIQWAFD